MPALFAFGIPNYFNFTFRAGSQSSRLAEGITHVQSNPGDMTDSEADKEIKTIAHLPSHGTGNIESSPCGTLNKLPLEVRMLIYVKVLYYNKGSIKQPHRFLGRHPPILAKDCTHVEAIDAAILRTCKTIYRETIRILYGTNRFSFRKPTDIKDFAHAGLGDVPFGFYSITSKPSSAVNNAPCGRLTMIRLMTLKLNSIDDDDSLEEIWLSWSRFFYAPGKEDQLVDFPALEWLALDLRDWDLDTGDGSKIRVKPFLQKLRPTGGLRHLTLIGVVHEQNLCDFKHGFVRQGGTFRPASSSVKTVATTTVTHDDLPEVSMYVRAIIEKDRASRTLLPNDENAGTSDLK